MEDMEGPDRTGREKIRHCRTISWTEGSLGRERRLPFHGERTRRGTRTTSSLLFKLIRQYVETWTQIGIRVDVSFSCHSHGTLRERRRTSRHWWSELERERERGSVGECVSVLRIENRKWVRIVMVYGTDVSNTTTT